MASQFTLWDQITSAAERMERVRTKLFTTRATQFYGSLGLSLDIVERTDDTNPTMATDQKHVFYNAEFVMTLTEAECMFVLAHEISHNALRHFARQGSRDTELWNIAADYELNADLIQADLTPPEGCLFDQRFAGMNAEQIYNVVSRENEQAKADQPGQGQPGQPGQPGQGQGSEPDLPHKPGLGGNMLHPTDDETGQPLDTEAMAELDQEWKQRVSQALGAARKAGMMAGGRVPSDLVQITEHLFGKSLVDWRQPLRAFIDRLGSTQSSWAKLSRRALGRGQVLPGQKVIRPSVVGWGIDCSGSMDWDKNLQGVAEAQAALDDGACDAIELIYVDTDIKLIERYEAGDTIELRKFSGGGTDFASAMAHISEQEYAALVFVTDGETSDWGIDPGCPVLWAITASQRDTDKLNPPFGEKLSLYTI